MKLRTIVPTGVSLLLFGASAAAFEPKDPLPKDSFESLVRTLLMNAPKNSICFAGTVRTKKNSAPNDLSASCSLSVKSVSGETNLSASIGYDRAYLTLSPDRRVWQAQSGESFTQTATLQSLPRAEGVPDQRWVNVLVQSILRPQPTFTASREPGFGFYDGQNEAPRMDHSVQIRLKMNADGVEEASGFALYVENENYCDDLRLDATEEACGRDLGEIALEKIEAKNAIERPFATNIDPETAARLLRKAQKKREKNERRNDF